MVRIVSATVMWLAAMGGTIVAHPHPNAHVPHWRTLCGRYEHVAAVRGAIERRILARRTRTHRSAVTHARPHYVIRNDSYGHRRECLRSRRAAPNFTIVRSDAKVKHAEPV